MVIHHMLKHLEARDDGFTPLIAAAQGGHLDVVRQLCGSGAELNKQESGVDRGRREHKGSFRGYPAKRGYPANPDLY